MNNKAESFKKVLGLQGEAAFEAVVQGHPELARKIAANLFALRDMKQDVQRLAAEDYLKERKR